MNTGQIYQGCPCRQTCSFDIFSLEKYLCLEREEKKKKGTYKDLCRLFKVIRKHAQLVKSNSEDANLGSVPLN